MPWYEKFNPEKRCERDFFGQDVKSFDRHALELLEKMLVLDPSQRISAKDALDAEYFWTDPLPCDLKRQRKSGNSSVNMRKQQKDKQQQHSRLQHGGQSHAAPHWPTGPNHPTNNAPPQLPSGPSPHFYGKQRGPPGPNRYPPSRNQSGGCNQSRGGYSGGSYPPQGRGAPYGAGPRGPSSGAYGVGPPNYT